MARSCVPTPNQKLRAKKRAEKKKKDKAGKKEKKKHVAPTDSDSEEPVSWNIVLFLSR